MGRYRKKPVVIEAIQFDGTNLGATVVYDWMMDRGATPFKDMYATREGVVIKTLEGEMVAGPSDWVIRGIKGEFYPCKDDIFKATYDEVPDEEIN